MASAIVDEKLLRFGQALESVIDAEIEKIETDDIQQLRERRLKELKQQAQKKQEWLAAGHGHYKELSSEKEFFSEVKTSDNVVCHFFRSSRPCQIMDKHLEILAREHLEAKFLKINAEKSPYLAEKLRIFMLPTLAMVHKGKVTGYVVGFDELGGTEDFPTEVLETRLVLSGALSEEKLSGGRRHSKQTAATVRRGGDTGSDDDDY
ncbi:unnamed protein product [Closterium sp. Yama58-4]|nr:unnamed protein product [Closterium sp. Yama58-4]